MAGVRRTSEDRKINSEGRILPKCARLLSGGRPSASEDAIRLSRREGRLRAVARWGKKLLPVVLSTGLARGLVLGLCSVVRLHVSARAPLGLYRLVGAPRVRG